MNRILKQRFNQISRQNNFLLATREASADHRENIPGKKMTVRPTKPDGRQPVDLRRD